MQINRFGLIAVYIKVDSINVLQYIITKGGSLNLKQFLTLLFKVKTLLDLQLNVKSLDL